jgi:histidinol-phosphate aminotransferase
MIGATTSLKVKTLVAERRKIIKDIREDTLAFLDQHHIHYVPSVSNKFMVDVKRPGREVIDLMAKEHVYIGRVWPSWPTYVRVTVGSREDMAKFKTAFLKVMA